MANLQSFERADYQQVKADLHRKILDRLDLEKLGKTSGDSARDEVLVVIRNAVNSEGVPLSFAERERLSREILDEIFGLGPLEPLLKDPTISDILVNRYDRVYVERAGKLELTTCPSKTIPPDADHRPHCLPGGTAHRRIVAHGGCAPGGRIARQRHHSAAGH